MQRKLAKYAKWKFLSVTLHSRKKRGEDKYWIKIDMKISVDGKVDGGKDEARVIKVDGKWFVESVPT